MVLVVQNLSVQFDGLKAVDSVSLTVRDAEIHGLIGPNGAGKTTFFNAVTGLVPQTGGRIELAGKDITALPSHARALAGIRRSFQSVQLVPGMTVLENVLIGLHGNISSAMGWNPLRLFSGGGEHDAQEKVLEILDFLGLAEFVLRPAEELTFAQQRFVEIARALVPRPRLLMLDEPAAGLSRAEVQTLDALLRQLATEWGLSILLVEHVLSLIFEVSDQVTVLDNGKLISEGRPAEVADDPCVKAAYLGEDADAVAAKH
jgi:branched-chain amino acid transport system ATP-binding protein